MQFVWPWLFYALPLPLLMLLMPRARQPSVQALRVPFYRLLATAAARAPRPGISTRRLLLLWSLWALLLAAAARPQWIGEPVALPAAGRDLLLAVDISGSMEMPDLDLRGQPVMRLDVVKEVAGDFIERRVGDRLGLILFGRRAYLQTPLTFDRKTTATMLREAEIGLAGKETAIGDAIGLAVKKLRAQPAADKILVLLTDGANTAGEVTPEQAAQLAHEEQLKIYTVGIGADSLDVSRLAAAQGINRLFAPRTINPSADLDEDSLKNIATATGGRYFRARDSEGLREIYREIDRLEPAEKDQQVFRPVHELYPWPLAAVFLISLLVAAGQVWSLRRQPQAGAAADPVSPS